MWRLKLSEGDEESVNKHVGRQFWEYDDQFGTSEEKHHIADLRSNFTLNRFSSKHSSDLLYRFQVHFFIFLNFNVYIDISNCVYYI